MNIWIFVIISQWVNNEAKCAITKIQNPNAADDYEQTLNFKWPEHKLQYYIEQLWTTAFVN